MCCCCLYNHHALVSLAVTAASSCAAAQRQRRRVRSTTPHQLRLLPACHLYSALIVACWVCHRGKGALQARMGPRPAHTFLLGAAAFPFFTRCMSAVKCMIKRFCNGSCVALLSPQSAQYIASPRCGRRCAAARCSSSAASPAPPCLRRCVHRVKPWMHAFILTL